MEVGVFTMVVLIVLIVTIGKVARSRHAAVAAVAGEGLSVDEAARLKAEVARLAGRVEVLERLATDPARRLADEISALDRKA